MATSAAHNTDIFDEEELLAIANDSDCDSEGNKNTSSSSYSDVGEEGVDSTSWAQGEDAHEITSNITSNIHRRPSQDGLRTTENISDAFGSDEEEDEDDDDGFLESWFEAENAKKRNVVSEKEAVAKKINVSAENITTDSVQVGVDTKNSNALKVITTELQLGCSVLDWISGRKRRHSQTIRDEIHDESSCSTVGLVAIERNRTGQDDKTLQRSSAILRLTTHSRKRPRVGTSNVVTATLEEETSSLVECSADNQMKYIGQATFPNEIDGATSSSEGTMVDCLAVYDRNKNCYILEMVDIALTNLTPQSCEDEEVMSSRKERTVNRAKIAAKNSPSEHSKLDSRKLIDPRSSAKLADKHIKSLKRGKGRKKTGTQARI